MGLLLHLHVCVVVWWCAVHSSMLFDAIVHSRLMLVVCAFAWKYVWTVVAILLGCCCTIGHCAFSAYILCDSYLPFGRRWCDHFLLGCAQIVPMPHIVLGETWQCWWVRLLSQLNLDCNNRGCFCSLLPMGCILFSCRQGPLHLLWRHRYCIRLLVGIWIVVYGC